MIRRYDFVEIRDGGTPDSPLVGRYCGTDLPPEFVSSGSRLYVRFKTDYSVAHDGFRISYEIGKWPLNLNYHRNIFGHYELMI